VVFFVFHYTDIIFIVWWFFFYKLNLIIYKSAIKTAVLKINIILG